MIEQRYDDRDGVIWMNGSFVPWREANLHVLNHGLHYGSCVFEGMRAYNGSIFKATEHNERLHSSANILGMKVPYSVAELDAASREALKRSGFADAYLRPIVWRGPEQMGVSAQKTSTQVAIAVWQWPSYFTPEARLKGIRIDWAPWRRPDPATAPVKAKAAGLYMIATMSKHAAEACGYSDALMLDWRGRVAETTGANIFLIKDGIINTPVPDCFLDGITRRTVIGLARAVGYQVVERAILPSELPGFSEVFVTGTAAEVTPIAEIAGEHFFQVGEITRRLMTDYDALVRGGAGTATRAAE